MLNVKETQVLVALIREAINCTAGDFGFTNEVDYESLGLTAHQYAGYLSQLEQKRYITIDNSVAAGQFDLSSKADDYLRAVGYGDLVAKAGR